MKIFTPIIFLFCLPALLPSCRNSEPIISRASAADVEAVDPYLTTDHQGNLVISWTEKDPVDSLYRLRFAVYDAQAKKFNKPITVTTSAGTKSSAESMNKVGFKSDGSVIAVFAKRFEDEKNPYAGAIYYSMSGDAGKKWSAPRFLHSDTSHAHGRGFFDIVTLKNGELAAIWLDGRYGKTITGSALFFASTERGRGFGMDKCIAKGTCECCRTDIQSGPDGAIHIAFRNIMLPSSLLGKQVRDMAYTSSSDNGKTFAPAKTLSADNWVINGCPHTGPSLAVAENTVHATWFTAGGNSGLYYAKLPKTQGNFTPRTSLSSVGRHPQMISIDDNKLAVVWEENNAGHSAAGGHDHSNADHQVSASAIVLKISRDGKEEKSIAVTNGKFADHHAVIAGSGKDLLIAWVREENGIPAIYYTSITPD